MLCTTTTATGLVGGPSGSSVLSGLSDSGGQGGQGGQVGPDGPNRLHPFVSFKFETNELTDKMILKKVVHLTSKS